MNINGVELNPDQFYKPEEAATALGWTASTLAAYRCRQGTIPYSKIGRAVLYRGSDIIAFVTASRVEHTGADPVRSEQAKERTARRNNSRVRS